MGVARVVEATIANGAALSAAVNCGGRDIVGIQMPADWTAADLSFQAGVDPNTVWDLKDDAASPAEITVGAEADAYIATSKLRGIFFLKVRSGTSGSPVNQGAERTIKLVLLDR